MSSMNTCSKSSLDRYTKVERVVDLLFIVAMLIPFAFQSITAYFYWIIVSTAYLAYKSWRWKI